MKLLEENIGRTLFHCLSLFTELSLRVMKIKTSKRHLTKLKRFYTTKETINKTKDTLRMEENICK